MTAENRDEGERATIEIIAGSEGKCLAIDNTRVAGPKPWGGGRVVASFQVDPGRIRSALRKNV